MYIHEYILPVIYTQDMSHIAKVGTRIRRVDVPCVHIHDVSRVNASKRDVNVPRVALMHIAKVYTRIRLVANIHTRYVAMCISYIYIYIYMYICIYI